MKCLFIGMIKMSRRNRSRHKSAAAQFSGRSFQKYALAHDLPGRHNRNVLRPERGFTPSAIFTNPSRS